MENLIHSADRLQKRAALDSSASLERYTSDLMTSVEGMLPGLFPEWYWRLTMERALGGASFSYPLDKERSYIGFCMILRPMEILHLIHVEWPIKDLLAFGYSCFADGENGDLWVFKKNAQCDPEVYFLE